MRVAIVLLLLVCGLSAPAQRSPFVGRYPQFRNLSGLAGGGYGVDRQGYRSLSGPVAYSTPVAYIMGHGQWRLQSTTLSFDSFPTLDEKRSNGTSVISFGETFGPVNLLASYMVKSISGDAAYNLQAQWIFPETSRWAVSIGVQDVRGRGGAAGEGERLDRLSSRSLFAVTTYRFAFEGYPFHLSAGVGNHRFGRPFGSLSVQVASPLRLWIEDDGYGINTGLLVTLRPWKRPGPELTAQFGLVEGRYFALSGGIGF